MSGAFPGDVALIVAPLLKTIQDILIDALIFGAAVYGGTRVKLMAGNQVSAAAG
ncbi:MAG: hypothetical protein R3F41_14560 [Gammaproteobacteria bacterium]|nr:hypothetical protein [Pseudomonadales bacterium]MCP5347200.1 hypothetical protein [Pseudomonadales bacterium]